MYDESTQEPMGPNTHDTPPCNLKSISFIFWFRGLLCGFAVLRVLLVLLLCDARKYGIWSKTKKCVFCFTVITFHSDGSLCLFFLPLINH